MEEKITIETLAEMMQNEFRRLVKIGTFTIFTILISYRVFSKNNRLSLFFHKMAQVVLRGRKYGACLLVITQRTVNVSKTVLTQCNTVICFQAFDETSFTFLGNYVGKDMVQVLPNTKKYHAMVAGKATKSNMSMIVDLMMHSVAG